MALWPTPEEERTGAWRGMRLWISVVLFFFTIQAATALFGLSALLKLPSGWITLITCIAIAELLIQRWHLWRTGVETALWIAGLCAFIFSLPRTGEPEAILAFAAAAAIAGWRMRNGLFGALSFVLMAIYFAASHREAIGFWFAVVIASVALVALTRTWSRPSTEFLWQSIVILLPVAAYCVALTVDWHHTNVSVVVLFVVLSIIFLAVGIRFLIRVPLVAAAIAMAIAIIEARDFIPLSLEVELIVFGAVAFAIGAAAMRALRGRTSGFVTDLRKSELEPLLNVAPAFVAAGGGGAPPSGGMQGGGGEFGGAGASGNY